MLGLQISDDGTTGPLRMAEVGRPSPHRFLLPYRLREVGFKMKLELLPYRLREEGFKVKLELFVPFGYIYFRL